MKKFRYRRNNGLSINMARAQTMGPRMHSTHIHSGSIVNAKYCTRPRFIASWFSTALYANFDKLYQIAFNTISISLSGIHGEVYAKSVARTPVFAMWILLPQ